MISFVLFTFFFGAALVDVVMFDNHRLATLEALASALIAACAAWAKPLKPL